MIDNLISDKKIELKRNYSLKFMNFLIFLEIFNNFMHFLN